MAGFCIQLVFTHSKRLFVICFIIGIIGTIVSSIKVSNDGFDIHEHSSHFFLYSISVVAGCLIQLFLTII